MRPIIRNGLTALLVVSVLFNVVLFMKWNRRRPVLTVNGQGISKNDIDNYLEQHAGPDVKAVLIERLLVDQEARRLGVAPTNKDVDDEFGRTRQASWEYALDVARKPWMADEMKNELREQVEKQRIEFHGAQVAPDEIEAEYRAHPEKYDTPDRAFTELAILRDTTHLDAIKQLMEKTDPPVSPDVISQQYPEATFLGDKAVFVIARPRGSRQISDIFNLKPGDVREISPGAFTGAGARAILVRMNRVEPGSPADLRSPVTHEKLFDAVAVQRSRPWEECLAQIWANSKFQSDDPADKAIVEQDLFPDRQHLQISSR